MEYDWRTRFGLPLSEVGRSMSLWEAARLAAVLVTDTSSATYVALSGWQYAATREALALADLYDAFMVANFKKPKPYPRPWDKPEAEPARRGNAAGRTSAEVIDLLARMGPRRDEPEGGDRG